MDAGVITTLATVIPAAVIVVGLLVRLVGLVVRLDHRFSALERRVDGLAIGVRSLNQQMSSLFALLSGVFAAFHRAGSLPDEDYRRTSQELTAMLSHATDPYVERITARANPLSPSEAQRFRELVAKARRGDFFSQAEAWEYNDLLRLVREDRGDDPGIWPLVALGAFLAGLYLGSRRDDDDSGAQPRGRIRG